MKLSPGETTRAARAPPPTALNTQLSSQEAWPLARGPGVWGPHPKPCPPAHTPPDTTAPRAHGSLRIGSQPSSAHGLGCGHVSLRCCRKSTSGGTRGDPRHLTRRPAAQRPSFRRRPCIPARPTARTHPHVHTHTHTRAYTHTHPHMCTHTQESREGVTQRTGESPKATTFTILGLGRCEPGLAAPAPPPLPSPAANGSGNRV